MFLQIQISNFLNINDIKKELIFQKTNRNIANSNTKEIIKIYQIALAVFAKRYINNVCLSYDFAIVSDLLCCI